MLTTLNLLIRAQCIYGETGGKKKEWSQDKRGEEKRGELRGKPICICLFECAALGKFSFFPFPL